MEIKYYRLGNKFYSFDVIETCDTAKGTIWLGKCRENSKEAWLDPYGVQFCGEARIPAEIRDTTMLPYGCMIWGGQVRDALPHGRRYYMNGRRW